MRRVVTIVAALGLVPIVAWASASAVPEGPVDCTSPTTTPGTECVAPAPGAAVAPVAGSTTTSTSTTTTTTTVVPGSGEPSTTSPSDPSATTPGSPPSSDPTTTTIPDATTTSTPVVDPSPTTTLDPNAATTTVDPGATTTTVEEVAPPPSVEETPAPEPAAPAPSPDADDSDIEEAPVAPPVEAPSGRIVIPSGAVDTGQVRAITFPVAGPVSFVNDFGACRDGCTRAHKGNDLIGDRLQPLLAMHDGVIDHLIDHPTAGFGVAIRGDDGWRYDTYHMNNDTPGTDDGSDDGTWRFLPGIVAGAHVTAGQQIGWMGDSGNAEGSVPHVHVEIHTPDGQAVNPYWSLRAAQRAVNCAVFTVGQPLPSAATPAPAADTDAGAADPAPTTSVPAPTTSTAGQALTDGATAVATPELAATTEADAAPSAADWLAAGWTTAALPTGWMPFTVTGGHPNSGQVAARFWISPLGYTPVDGAAALVGDPRYDAGVDCAQPTVEGPATNIPAELGAILATIRAMETGGDYATTITTSTASGAYAFLDSSWGGYGGYARAKDAPPAVQDANAAALASSILQRNGGDVSTIPVSWYIGHVPVGAEWDTVPVPTAGNKLTPRQYQDRWMKKYAQVIGDPSAWVSSSGGAPAAAADISKTCRTVVVNVGETNAPVYALAQAQAFLVAADGRAVPSATDACDPGRALDAAPPALPTAPTPLESLATLVPAPSIKSTGAR